MKHKGKVFLLVCVMALPFLFSGCSSIGVDVQTLMRPPKATGERQEIYEAVEQQAGSGFIWKYPRTGQYRSAVIMQDVTGDGVEEAVALYAPSEQNTGVGTVALFLQQKDKGGWEVFGSYENTAVSVDQVCFGDLDQDGRMETVIGWGNSVGGMREFSIYDWSDSGMEEIPVGKQMYSEMLLYDFDGDGGMEIFTAALDLSGQSTTAKLMRLSAEQQLEILGSVQLDPSVVQYAHVAAGQVSADGTIGVYLDGAVDASALITELVYWDKEQNLLHAPFSLEDGEIRWRETEVYAGDINGDGVLEFPMPVYPPDAGVNQAQFFHWMNWNAQANQSVLVSAVYIHPTDGYQLVLPSDWQDTVTVREEESSRSVTFYEWVQGSSGSTGALGASLLKIQVFSQVEWDTLPDQSTFHVLAQEEGSVYVCSLPNPSHPLAKTAEDITAAFSLSS